MLSQGLLLCAAVIALELLLYCKFTLVFAAVAAAVSGARSRNRTGTLLPARDFKSLVSTYFTIRAAVTLRNAAINSGQSYWIRTSDLQLRRLLLYPTELRTAAVVWWAPRESNTAPTDYESAALTNMS